MGKASPDKIRIRIGSEALRSTVYDADEQHRPLSPWMSGALGPRLANMNDEGPGDDSDIPESGPDSDSLDVPFQRASVNQDEVLNDRSHYDRESDSILFLSEQTIFDQPEQAQQVPGVPRGVPRGRTSSQRSTTQKSRRRRTSNE